MEAEMIQTEGSLPFLNPTDPDFHKNCMEIAKDVESRKTTVLDMVLSLNHYFECGVDKSAYGDGVHALSTILHYIEIDLLNSDEVIHFCKFYKGALFGTSHLIPAALLGIIELSKYGKELKNHYFADILTTLFQYVSCQAQKYSERLKIYQIFKNMLRYQTEELLQMGPDFVNGVISTIDGERDPVNLIFLFEWLPQFINTVKLDDLTHDMFEVMACYFPIDFRVPEANTKGVSRETLAEALKSCLCASKDFANEAIDLALDKLNSNLHIAKVDSLQLLIFGCKKFSDDAYNSRAPYIMTLLQKELFKSSQPELEVLLLTTLTEVTNKLCVNVPNLFTEVWKANVGNINVDSKSFITTCKLFLAMSKGNYLLADKIYENIQPRLMNLYNIASTKEHKTAILLILIKFIKVGELIDVNKTGIVPFLLTILTQPDQELKALSLDALAYMTVFFEEMKVVLFEEWKKLLLENTNEDVQQKLHGCILHYSLKYPDEVILWIESFPSPVDELGILMDNLSILSSTQPFTDWFLKYQLTYFDINAKVCLKTLNKAVKLHMNSDDFFEKINTFNVLETKLLCDDFLNGVKNIDEDDLVNIMNILLNVIGRYSREEQSDFMQKYFCKILEQFEMNDRIIYFVCGILSPLYAENRLQFDILDKLSVLATEGNFIATQLLANLLNKMAEEEIKSTLAIVKEKIQDNLKSADNELVQNCGVMTIWLTKALFMRGHQEKEYFLDILVQYAALSEEVANTMKILISDDLPIFASYCHCNRRLLYKQEMFVKVCQFLDTNDRLQDGKNNNLTLAFATLAHEIPKDILYMYFEQFIRLIMRCLENNGSIRIIKTICEMVQSGDTLVEKYLDEYIVRLLALARNNVSMKVRVQALRCIRLFVNESIPKHKLVRYKFLVTNSLGHCLDDKKRLVRKEAAEARLKWILLDAPI